MSNHIAIDIGGSHGRVILGQYQNAQWHISEIGTFSTSPLVRDGEYFWDVHGMFDSIQAALQKAAQSAACIDTIGTDSMGVAFALLDKDQRLITLPVYTRTPQTEKMRSRILSDLGSDALYAVTGLEQEKLNSLYYLAQLKETHPEYIGQTAHFVMLPDLLNFWLTGVIHNEYTIATTSNLWDIGKGNWSKKILDYIGFEKDIVRPVSYESEYIGRLKPEYAFSDALKNTSVVHAASHDTAAACQYISSVSPDSAFIIAGTWGITGCLLSSPLLSAEAKKNRFANEGAPGNKIKFVNNIPCMSILQSCIHEWYPHIPVNWETFYEKLGRETSHHVILDLNHPGFKRTEGMADFIKRLCRESRQYIPRTEFETAYILLESIAAHFAVQIQKMQNITKTSLKSVVLLGGASRSEVFVSLCKEKIAIPVVIGNSEASCLGNLQAQKNAKGVYSTWIK